MVINFGRERSKDMKIQLSEHFTYQKLLRFSLPTIAMMLFTSVYSIVDGFFVSNYVGKTAFAAVNLIMPYLIIQGCFGFMIGAGGSALVAKTLGEGKRELANQYFTMMIEFVVILGVAVSAASVIFMRPIALFLGAEGDMARECVVYGTILSVFNTVFMLQFLFQSFFVVAEKPNLGFCITMAAGLINIALDALFIAVFHWGVAGAAAATVIGQCVGGGLPLMYFWSSWRQDSDSAGQEQNKTRGRAGKMSVLIKNTSLLHLAGTKLEIGIFLKTCGNGSSELMANISASVIGMLYNFQLIKYAGENGIAAYGVVMYTQMIFFAIFFGYAVGTSPIVSYHYGAGNHAEMKSLLRKSMFLMLGGGIVMMLTAQLSAPVLSGFFVGYDGELLAMTRHAFVIFAYAYLLSGMNIYASAFFTALNNGAVSAAISFLRTLVFQTAAVLILPLFFGIDGIWWAVVLAEVMAFMISAAFLAGKRGRYHY